MRQIHLGAANLKIIFKNITYIPFKIELQISESFVDQGYTLRF